MPNKKDEKDKKELSKIEEKKLETEVDESDDSKYYDFDDTIKKVFEEPKKEVQEIDNKISKRKWLLRSNTRCFINR